MPQVALAPLRVPFLPDARERERPVHQALEPVAFRLVAHQVGGKVGACRGDGAVVRAGRQGHAGQRRGECKGLGTPVAQTCWGSGIWGERDAVAVGKVEARAVVLSAFEEAHCSRTGSMGYGEGKEATVERASGQKAL